jgi:hypothetical protein
MNISIIITKLLNVLLLLFGFFSFSLLPQNLKYRYYQWAGLKSPWIKKKLFKRLLL